MTETQDEEFDWNLITQAVTEFSTLDDQAKLITRRKTELRDRLLALVEVRGEPDEKGSLVLPLPTLAGNITALAKQRKVSRAFDEERARELLQSKVLDDGTTLWDRCTTLVPLLDEEKLMDARYSDLLTDDEIDEMYPTVESWAFVPTRVKKGR